MQPLANHLTASLSDLDRLMVRHIPPGGNWRSVPPEVPSRRLRQIREAKEYARTTYYGRLRWDRPAYTISTCFNRPGNGCFIHPAQDRLISQREAARLQSFPDAYRFLGPKTAVNQQIGNAVPPLMAYAAARELGARTAVDLFAGAGGLGLGFAWAGTRILAAVERNPHACATYRRHHAAEVFEGDIRETDLQRDLLRTTAEHLHGKPLDIVIGGPPCQGFSTAGYREETDQRNSLMYDFIRMIKSLQPRMFLMENVPGFLTLGGGRPAHHVFSRLKALGYTLSILRMKAEDYGVPQLRRRVFVVGRLDGTLIEKPLPTVRTPVTVAEAIADLPPLSPGEQTTAYTNGPSTLYQRWARGLERWPPGA